MAEKNDEVTALNCRDFIRELTKGDYPTDVTVIKCGKSIMVAVKGIGEAPALWLDINTDNKTYTATYPGQ